MLSFNLSLRIFSISNQKTIEHYGAPEQFQGPIGEYKFLGQRSTWQRLFLFLNFLYFVVYIKSLVKKKKSLITYCLTFFMEIFKHIESKDSSLWSPVTHLENQKQFAIM